MQSRNVHDFLTEIVPFKQKQPDDISERQSKYYSRVNLKAFPILRNRGIYI